MNLNKKILIVLPPESVDEKLKVKRKVIYPVEPAVTAAVLKERNYSVAGIDLNLTAAKKEDLFTALRLKIKEHSPHIVLIMSHHLTFLIKEQLEFNIFIIKKIQERNKNIKIILTGSNPSSYPEKYFSGDIFPDILIRGEIEKCIIDVIKNIEDTDFLRKINGVCLKISGKAVLSEKINYVENLNELPAADREVFDYKEYFKFPETGNIRYPEKSRRFTHIAATRGCNVNCGFCKVKYLRGKFRYRSAEHIIKEIDYLVNELGIKELIFLDENLLMNKPNAVKLFDLMIEKKYKLHWFCGGGTSIFLIDKLILDKMRKSGCYRLTFAVESASERILKSIIKKPINLIKARELINYAKNKGLEIIGYFMIGLPTETKKELQATVNLAAEDIFDYVVFSIYTPEKGTRLYEFCEKNNLFKDSNFVNLSKRAESNLKFPDFNADLLIKIRKEEWENINFSNSLRKEKLKKMFGMHKNG